MRRIEAARPRRTASTVAAALRSTASQSPASTAAMSKSWLPTPTALAPAAMNAVALSELIPPTAIVGMCGRGPRRSRKYYGPNVAAGKTFTIPAPRTCAR